jgi:predicted amidophosphoribosyltransferase
MCYLTQPDPCPSGFPLTATSTPYDLTVSRLITAHKDRQGLSLTPHLADRLAHSVAFLLGQSRVGGRPVILVPVPSATAAVRERGFDATGALARAAAHRLRPRFEVQACPVLTQTRRVPDQVGLGAEARRHNLSGGLRVSRRPPAGAVVIIVDDVVTTGTSLTEAGRTLRAARIAVLGAATVAATVRFRPSRPARRREVP